METKTLSQKGIGWIKKHPIISIIGVIFIIGLIGSTIGRYPFLRTQNLRPLIYYTPSSAANCRGAIESAECIRLVL